MKPKAKNKQKTDYFRQTSKIAVYIYEDIDHHKTMIKQQKSANKMFAQERRKIIMYNLIEYDDEDHQFIKLPHLYEVFKDSFIYYQVIEISDDMSIPDYEFKFHLYKESAKEKKPILMTRIDKSGRLGTPIDLLRISRLHDDQMFLVENGITDFIITTKPPEKGVSRKDDKYLEEIFKYKL